MTMRLRADARISAELQPSRQSPIKEGWHEKSPIMVRTKYMFVLIKIG